MFLRKFTSRVPDRGLDKLDVKLPGIPRQDHCFPSAPALVVTRSRCVCGVAWGDASSIGLRGRAPGATSQCLTQVYLESEGNQQLPVCACARRGRGPGRVGPRRQPAAARASATGRVGSRGRAGAARCSPFAHTKPRRGENGGRGRSGGRGGGDGDQNGGRERRARRAERQRGSGP